MKHPEIPFFDLGRQHKGMQKELHSAFQRVMEKAFFSQGEEVAALEQEWSEAFGYSHSLACANASDGLELCLRAMGIGFGDQVLVPAFGWVSAVEAVRLVGAQPVFYDVDSLHALASIDTLEQTLARMGKKPRLCILVHLYGQAHPEEVLLFLEQREIPFIEDCAQAHGAKWGESFVGTRGETGVFSFYPTKNIGALGEAGMIVCSSDRLANKISYLKNHGQSLRNLHQYPGRNSRMDELQAAFLRVKLLGLKERNDRRSELAATYHEGLKDLEEVQLPQQPWEGHVFHQYVIQCEKRSDLQSFLQSQGIGTMIHYPYAIVNQEAYLNWVNDTKYFPNSLGLAGKVLSLPIFPELENREQLRVMDAIKAFFN